MTLNLRVAIVGAGPAGIYAGNILRRQVDEAGGQVAIDLFESLPAPYGLIRYGVAPDHPRIKGIVNSLHEMLDEGTIRLIGNVEVGRDVTVDELRERYDAVIFATGALKDAPLDIPGIDLPGSYGAADLVAWYDGHPDVSRDWPLEAESIAVIGNGNVALDVARVLAKHPADLLSTDIPANVHAGLLASPVTDVHVFGRRGPSQVKFTPIELRELGEVPDVDIVVYDDDFARAEGDEHAAHLLATNNQVKVMTRTLNGWRKPADWQPTASRRLHLHFFHSPVEVLGSSAVEGVRFERTRPVGDGSVVGTGEFVEVPVQAVYRAVGYASSPIAGVPFDDRSRVIPNEGGRVTDGAGAPTAGVYATGWIKRGPVGLIGHTKGDALETITNLVEDAMSGRLAAPAVAAADGDEVLELLEARGIRFTTWNGWLALDAHERSLGEAFEGPVTRERVKVVPRDEQVEISRAGALVAG
ncbi:ferredoxin--NADP+ reductase [Agromyces flavus]|uniref:ferredoxin--NADP(+) reductase n=1 Tax=Agromyces flavus TaxID=589382 RepID=A0A1H1Z9X2_9MICO|nr:FAD-dependent oxidoreductase [Agromyces flavus]MCP2366970.1 ferredoxin--NADP+ reductase [Agromyces flavus]GGI46660.1 pyridine nucleotide-disulfide oxidoreductase [Agromyces flavus]SDT29986.1 ferredoxin--NADP+ reductase [Agromyces flavus]